MLDHFVPFCSWNTRVRDESIGGDNPYRWQTVTTDDIFKDKKVILFSLPGAFTPTCSTYQLPNFEKLYDDFKAQGIDDIYCLSVNDSFVMNAWAKSQNLKNVKVIPDGNGDFTRHMGMLVNMSGATFGYRSWRYAIVVDNYRIEHWFIEPGKEDLHAEDPYGESAPENVLKVISDK